MTNPMNTVVSQCCVCKEVTGCHITGSLVSVKRNCPQCCGNNNCGIALNKEMFDISHGYCDKCVKNYDMVAKPIVKDNVFRCDPVNKE